MLGRVFDCTLGPRPNFVAFGDAQLEQALNDHEGDEDVKHARILRQVSTSGVLTLIQCLCVLTLVQRHQIPSLNDRCSLERTAGIQGQFEGAGG